jgi:hypothetical protein
VLLGLKRSIRWRQVFLRGCTWSCGGGGGGGSRGEVHGGGSIHHKLGFDTGKIETSDGRGTGFCAIGKGPNKSMQQHISNLKLGLKWISVNISVLLRRAVRLGFTRADHNRLAQTVVPTANLGHVQSFRRWVSLPTPHVSYRQAREHHIQVYNREVYSAVCKQQLLRACTMMSSQQSVTYPRRRLEDCGGEIKRKTLEPVGRIKDSLVP